MSDRVHTGAPALVLAILFAGCRAGAPPARTAPAPPSQKSAPAPEPAREVAPEEGGEGTFALEEPFTSLSASRLATGSDRILRGLAFHGLTRYDAAGRLEGELAVKWEMSAKGSEWVFHLRPETAFTNGRYLEARHVVASWEKLVLAPEANYAWLLEAVEGFDEVRSGKAPHLAGLILEDGLTLRVRLRTAQRDFPARLSHPALGVSAFGEDVEGCGYYQVWGTPKAQIVVMRSNPEYFRGLPHLDEIAFVRGAAAALEKIGMGALDTAVLPPMEKELSDSRTKIFTLAEGRTYILGLNRSTSSLARGETAAQLVAALDRDAIIRETAGPSGIVPATLLENRPAGDRKGSAPAGAPAVPAGLGRIDLVYADGDPWAGLLAGKIVARLQKAGARPATHPTHVADLPGVLARKEYHLYILPTLALSPDPRIRLEEMIRQNSSIPAPLMTQLRDLGKEAEPSRITAAVSGLEEAIRAGAYIVPLGQVPRRFLVAKGICGLRPDPFFTLDWPRLWKSRHPGGECD